MFNRIEISNGFYFSYTYDLTRSLQESMIRKVRKQVGKGEPILQQLSDIYAKDIYINASSNPTSRFDDQTAQFMQDVGVEGGA